MLLFFSKLLAQIQKPMLHVINVYRPVQVRDYTYANVIGVNIQYRCSVLIYIANLLLFLLVFNTLTPIRAEESFPDDFVEDK